MSAESTWLFDHDGKTYAVDYEDITTAEAIVLKKFLGVTPAGWLEMMGESDPEAIQFFAWLGFTRAGENIGKPGDVDVPMFKLNVRTEVEPPADGEAEADPTFTPEDATTP
jgi:hypothetical protein